MQVMVELTAVVPPAEAVALLSSGLEQLHAAGESRAIVPGDPRRKSKISRDNRGSWRIEIGDVRI